MTEDARFEDAGAQPLNLGALDVEDLQVISALLQDAVFPGAEVAFQRRARRLALLVNRVRWEDVEEAKRQSRPVERVRAMLVIDNVLSVSSQGVARGDKDTVYALLSLGFTVGGAPGGQVLLTLAGDGALRAEVEALEVTLRDVTRPYAAPSGKAPSHPD